MPDRWFHYPNAALQSQMKVDTSPHTMKTVLRFRQAIRGILPGFARIAWFAGVASSLSAAEPLATWTSRTSPTNVNFTAIAYGNNTFVAMAQDFGIAITSPDGVTWTKRTTPLPTREVYGLDYGGGLFVAAGDVGKIITSPDGITWTTQTSGTSRNLDSRSEEHTSELQSL